MSRWYLSTAEARARQQALRARVVTHDALGEVRHVAGTDCAFPDGGRTTRAVVVVLRWPDLAYVEHAVVERPTDFPYIPGLLSFREVPALEAALAKLKTRPDLLLCDGQGYAHPRRCGLACHLGVAADIPSIGVAKSRLIGRHTDPDRAAGSRTALSDGDETIGTVLRTRTGVNPLYVSIGHRVSLDTAVRWVLDCCRGYRLPETTRWADGLAGDPDFTLPQRRSRGAAGPIG